MKKIIYSVSLLLLSLVAIPALAQTESELLSKVAMQRFKITFLTNDYLSFDVQYRYANEASPQQYLDSLSGQFKIHGSKYWSVLDGQETVFDSLLMLAVFPEDRMLFLSRPATGAVQGNPLDLLDSFLIRYTATSYEYRTTPAEEVVTVHLPAGSRCKKITWYIDRTTGYLNRTESLMRSDQLYDPSVQALVTDAASVYVVVETLYRNYRKGGFDDTVFDLGRYFRKEGNNYIALAPYEGYTVFKGSTGL